MHQRQVIRDAVVAAIIAKGTAAGSRVYPTRKLPYQIRELPAIAVYTMSEDSSLGSIPRELDRNVSIVVECIVDAASSVDNAMDDLAEEVEAAMDLDYTFGGVCADSELASTDLDVAEDADREIGLMELTYKFIYRTDAFIEPAAPDEFETAHADYSLGGEQDAADQTSDTITVKE